nr:MAG TPA: hypothetical protein [Caudoviricetes sp.]
MKADNQGWKPAFSFISSLSRRPFPLHRRQKKRRFLGRLISAKFI